MKAACSPLLRVALVDPLGPHRESLSSFITRLARENDVSPGILLSRSYNSGALDGFCANARSLGRSFGQSINGSGAVAAAMVRRTEDLTLLDNLRASTALAFAPFATMNGLQRHGLAWSPDFLCKQKIKYYPLLWALEPVRVCIKTRKPLVSVCPNCRQSLTVFSCSGHAGCCNHCGGSLGDKLTTRIKTDPISTEIRDLDYELWIAEKLSEFIVLSATRSVPESFSYTATLEFWLNKFEIRGRDKSAALVGANPAAMSNWLARKSTPRLRMTMNLCWVFGVSLVDFLACRVPPNHNGKLEKPMDGGRRYAACSKRRRVDRSALEADLTSILRDNKYAMMSFAEICARKLRRHEVVVRDAHEELSKKISSRYLQNRKLAAQMKRAQFCAAIDTAARFLHARGIVPNHKNLKAYLDSPGKLRCDWAIEALAKVRRELGYEDPAEQLWLLI